MIASTLQLSLNRAKVSFLLCGSNEKFINLSRMVGAVSYYNYESSHGRRENVEGNHMVRDSRLCYIVKSTPLPTRNQAQTFLSTEGGRLWKMGQHR